MRWSRPQRPKPSPLTSLDADRGVCGAHRLALTIAQFASNAFLTIRTYLDSVSTRGPVPIVAISDRRDHSCTTLLPMRNLGCGRRPAVPTHSPSNGRPEQEVLMPVVGQYCTHDDRQSLSE